ncbi:MAG: SprB repeat-containing protein [Cyclobacteriaceae bacterium]|nr:SprB repeat-containing protein [Cyclobacteriaceae bacterium]
MKEKLKHIFIVGWLLTLMSCEYIIDPAMVDCSQTSLKVTIGSVTGASSCSVADGSVSVLASGGSESYTYKLGVGGSYQSSALFDNLPPGIYEIFVMDVVGCETSIIATIGAPGGVTITDVLVTDASCGQNDGAITVTATGGANLMYKLDNGTYAATSSFSNLAAGSYTITTTDNSGCEFSATAIIKSGVPFANIKAVMAASCAVAGCHVAGGRKPDFTIDANIISSADGIKFKTGNGTMPPKNSGLKLSAAEVAAIACWVDSGAQGN